MKTTTIHPVVQRMLEIADDLGYSPRKFEMSIKKSNGYINGMKSRGGSPNIDVLLDVVSAFPEYNLLWLATGEGEMKEPEGVLNEPGEDYNTQKDASFEKLVRAIVKDEVDPRFERIAESLKILTKRGLSGNDIDKQNSANS
ncbi:hypothetical protein [Winogradskyella pulchriflava]|uniref:HTH cro/C1-type domain-containing protein n=1 Tax=Winogradskyella pulchriflava TaxID=1110688 RepID=A0ABV6QF80_9FLAO